MFSLESCENLNDPGKIKFKNSVLFNLTTGNSKQKIYIYNTYPVNYSFEDPPPFINYDKFIAENAKIKIINENSEYSNFELVQEDTIFTKRYYTNASELIIRPNQKYSIEVESNGQVIRGSTITIGSFEILSVEKVAGSSYNISWDKCPGTMFYQLNIIYFFKDSIIYGGTRILATLSRNDNYIITTDTLFNVNYLSKIVSIDSKSDSMYITVGAYDLNTYKYFFEGIDKLNIENAYGYIGSSTVKSVKVIFKK